MCAPCVRSINDYNKRVIQNNSIMIAPSNTTHDSLNVSKIMPSAVDDAKEELKADEPMSIEDILEKEDIARRVNQMKEEESPDFPR